MDEVAAVRAATVEVIVPLSDELEESWLHKVFLKDLMDKMADAAARRANEYVIAFELQCQTASPLTRLPAYRYILFLNFAKVLCSQDEDERLIELLLPVVKAVRSKLWLPSVYCSFVVTRLSFTARKALAYPVPNVQFGACEVLIAMAESLDPEDAMTTLRPRVRVPALTITLLSTSQVFTLTLCKPFRDRTGGRSGRFLRSRCFQSCFAYEGGLQVVNQWWR